MRAFIDGILAFIGTTSLTDDEWGTLSDLSAQVLTADLYARVLAVIDSRETISSVRDRLTHYFQAAGIQVLLPDSAAGKSNIFLGSDL